MRLFLILIGLAATVLYFPGPATAQQLSARMNDVLKQEGKIEDFVFSSDQSPVYVTIGPDSRKDRQVILAACQTVLEDKWQTVENQYGYDQALLKTKNALATTIDMLVKARRNQQGLDDLQSLYWQFENDYNGSGRMLECTLRKALAMAGGTTAKDGVNSVPDVAGLGSNSQQVLLHIRKSRYSDAEVRRDHRAILRQCENFLDASFAHHIKVGQASSVAASSADYPLSLAAGKLYRARRSGNSKELDDELRSMEIWARNNPNIGNQLSLCFHRAAKSLVSGSQATSAAPRVQAALPAPPPSQLSDATRIALIQAYSAEIDSLLNRYPYYATWGDQHRQQYNLFKGVSALGILEKYRARMDAGDFDRLAAAAMKLRDNSLAACPACKPEYPQITQQVPIVPPTPTPERPAKGGVLAILSNSLFGGAAKQAPEPPAVASTAKQKAQPPKITMMAALGNGCVTAMGRNYRISEFDKSTQLIDLVLKNSCGKAQVVKVDVSGLGMLGWPAIYNLGLWASTANADVPAGIPFTPIRAMSEGGTYLIQANGEHVADQWVPPPPLGSDNELKIWVASCDAYSSLGMKQVVFRPAPHFALDSRAHCGPSRLRN